jgi:hypothetical protein
MKNSLYILFLLIFNITFSQVNFQGLIKDANGNNITGANVIAIEKESKILDGFGISNDSGFFRLNLKKDLEYEIKISFIGFKEEVFDLKISENLEKDFILEEQAEALDEVEIVYEMPVTIKGDTIVYNADSFNTGSEKKISRCLKKPTWC